MTASPPGTIPTLRRQALRFELGGRTLWRAHRTLVQVGHSLDAAIAGRVEPRPPLDPSADGYYLRSLPLGALDEVLAAHPDMIVLERQRYARHFIRMEIGFGGYMERFSSKTRSTLRRKRKRWVDEAGGLRVVDYHRPEQVDAFHRLARAVSARTYQERLLDAGLPDGPDALDDMRRRAADDRLRAYILFHGDRPASYLYLPVEGDTLVYAYLGYDPAFLTLSAGTILQMEALERLFAEDRFRHFDFTEGEGDHKRMFGTDHVTCLDMLLLRPTLANRGLVRALRTFDRAVLRVSTMAARSGLKPRLLRLLRR